MLAVDFLTCGKLATVGALLKMAGNEAALVGGSLFRGELNAGLGETVVGD